VNAYHSAGVLRRLAPEMLLPSLGRVMDQDVDGALSSLQDSLSRLCDPRPLERAQIADVEEDRLERVTDHVWFDPRGMAIPWFVLSDSGKALVIDYGYRAEFGDGATAEEVCAKTIRTLMDAGARHFYISNLPVARAQQVLGNVIERAGAKA
jgi:hypothetical protein